MSRFERLKAVTTRGIDTAVKGITKVELSDCFSDFDDRHSNVIQNCVINYLSSLVTEIEVWNFHDFI